jgi:hypothetical protein
VTILKKIWFDNVPKTTFATRYIQSSANLQVAGMTKQSFQTLTVDILQAEESILADCAPNCRNEIRKGKKIGLDFHAGPIKQTDGDFIHHFLSTKKLGRFNRTYLVDPHALICVASLNGIRLSTHMYFVSRSVGRVRLVYSAVADPVSLSCPSEVSTQRLIGIANRFLHFSAMLYFKMQGLKVYDFGGIGLEENDLKIKGINDFKRSFGGSLVTEYNYTPIIISTIEKILYRYSAPQRKHQQHNSNR